MFANNTELAHQLFYSHNFGHNGPLAFHGLGINGKISELQGAMGLAVFNHIDEIFEERKKVCDFYNVNLNFNKLKTIKLRENTEWNYSYYPVVFESEQKLLKTIEKLNQLNIFPRRYFYPSLNQVPYVDKVNMPISEDIASRIICLPLYVGLEETDLKIIVSVLNEDLC